MVITVRSVAETLDSSVTSHQEHICVNSNLVLPRLEVEIEGGSEHRNAGASKNLERILSHQPFDQ